MTGAGMDESLRGRALEAAVARCEANLRVFGPGLYPAPASVGGVYPAIPNVEWTSSFWSGMLWLSYEATGRSLFRDEALARLTDFRARLGDARLLQTHDLGFLYTLSCVAAYRLTGSAEARGLALEAADRLMLRFHEKAGIIQAWGDLADPAQRGRMIIDCDMNLPLLFWASEESGKQRYREAAARHLEEANRALLRPDDSTYHTFYYDTETGKPLRGATEQGLSDSSCWARGQAWAIYGLAANYRYLPKASFLEQASRLARYYLDRLPKDLIPRWDLSLAEGERDSSAAAIAACGLLELAQRLPAADQRREEFRSAAIAMATSLARDYATASGSNGLLLHAVYNKPKNEGVDECCIWGDYFYLELLVRLGGAWAPYW
jgi:unsaturated chondroitin disaccharide hydrolase